MFCECLCDNLLQLAVSESAFFEKPKLFLLLLFFLLFVFKETTCFQTSQAFFLFGFFRAVSNAFFLLYLLSFILFINLLFFNIFFDLYNILHYNIYLVLFYCYCLICFLLCSFFIFAHFVFFFYFFSYNFHNFMSSRGCNRKPI